MAKVAVRRLVVVVVFAAVAACLGLAAPVAGQSSGLDDLSDDAYYWLPVTTLAGRGVFAGTLCDDGFCPEEPIDRKTMAVWTVRVLDGRDPPPVSEARFDDVDAVSFYAPFVERMAELGVTAGCGDGSGFCPDRNVTRAQMAVFLSRAYSLPAGPDPMFSDVADDAWYASDVAKLAASGITAGCGDGTRFCPDRDTTRAQMATFLARAIGAVPLPAEFSWSLASHCSRWPPEDPHTDPGGGCPVWWSHLLDLEPSPGGITADDMRSRLTAALPNYVSGPADSLDRLPAPAREIIANTVTELAAGDPLTADQVETITAHVDGCTGYSHAAACALRNGINFVTAHGPGWWLQDVHTVVHEWAHLRDFRVAPGGGYAAEWCDRIAKRASIAESTGQLITHTALLEAASAAHDAPLVSGPGCAAALIARFAPEIGSHDQPGQILELSANAQAQVWMRRDYASAEARWWAAETAAGYPKETQPLARPLNRGAPVEPPEPGRCDDFHDRDPELCVPDDCHDGMHEHPYRPNTRHYHRGGLEPHTHHRWHILVDGIAVPTDATRPAGSYCEYPDGRRVIGNHSGGERFGDAVSVGYVMFSPDGLWAMGGYSICIDITDPDHPRHDPGATNADSVAAHQVCDDTSDHLWEPCDTQGRCPTETEFADGEYDGGWVTCGEPGWLGYYWEICRRTTGQPRAN